MSMMGPKVETKDQNGKVVNVVNSKPAWISKISGLTKLFQQKLRLKTAVPVRVVTNAILGIEGQGGLGTGFRVANNLVTASHVVGGSETVRVTWGSDVFNAHVVRHLGNDVTILNLPTEAQTVQPFKFPKTMEDGTVVVTGINANGDYIVATAEGIRIRNQWTYNIQTLDGMSGAPVTNAAGKVVGVHLSNTGFTGGGAVITPADFHVETEVERLRRELKELKEGKSETKDDPKPKPLDQSRMDTSDIVALIREAVKTEIEVLRAELDAPFDQAKGKTKRKGRIAAGSKARKNKRVKAWTEEEYKRLQEQGYTRQQLQDMATIIIEKMNEEFGDEYLGDDGFPTWQDLEEDERKEIEREWFYSDENTDYQRDSYRQKTGLKPTVIVIESDFNPNTHSHDVFDKYSTENYVLTTQDIEVVGNAIEEYDTYLLKWMMRNLNGHQEWRKGVNASEELKNLAEEKKKLDELMLSKGLLPFSQRKKKERKARNIKRAPKNSRSPSPEGQ